MINNINHEKYLRTLQIVRARQVKEAGIKELLASGAGYLNNGFSRLAQLGGTALTRFHNWWHWLKDNKDANKKVKAIGKASKTLNDAFKFVSPSTEARILAGKDTIDGADRTYHAIKDDKELHAGINKAQDIIKDISKGNAKKYIKKGLEKAQDAIIERYPSIGDTIDAGDILINGPEKKSSYSLGHSVAKVLLKQAMYKKADEKNFTTDGLDPDSPEYAKLLSDGQPVYGPLTPKEQMAQATLADSMAGYDSDIKDIKNLEADIRRDYNKYHTPRQYYDTMGEAIDDAIHFKLDPGKYYHPKGPLGIGNTVTGEGVRALFDSDRYYNTEEFSDGYYGPLRKVLNDVGWGGLFTLPNYTPYGIGRAIKPYNMFAMGEASVPIAIMSHLGQDLGQARGAYMNEKGYSDMMGELAGFRNDAYKRKQDALDDRNRVFAEEENWASPNIDNIMYRSAANSQYDDLNMMNLASSNPNEFVRIMSVRNPQVPKDQLRAMAEQMKNEASIPMMGQSPDIIALRGSATINDLLSKLNNK